MLDELLQYHETPQDEAFVARVMQGVRRQQRQRKLILAGSGVVGAAFGVGSMLVLSEPISQVFSGDTTLLVSVAAIGLVAFLSWLFHEEVGLGG